MLRRALSFGLPLATFAVIAAAWELLVAYGGFPPKLVPGLGTIADAFVRLACNGILLAATEATLYRLGAGFLIAALIGVSLGIAMGRRQWIEDTALPIVTFLYPIPGLAYAPLFVLWFGLGDFPTILLVGVASCFTVIINTWKGVKAVKFPASRPLRRGEEGGWYCVCHRNSSIIANILYQLCPFPFPLWRPGPEPGSPPWTKLSRVGAGNSGGPSVMRRRFAFTHQTSTLY